MPEKACHLVMSLLSANMDVYIFESSNKGVVYKHKYFPYNLAVVNGYSQVYHLCYFHCVWMVIQGLQQHIYVVFSSEIYIGCFA